MMKKFLVLLMFVACISSCNKNNCNDIIIECSDGYIFWGGEPAADGIGWYYATSNNSPTIYQVENLPVTFKKDGMAVNVCLTETNKPVKCGMCAGTSNYYEIKKITKR